MNDLRSAVLSVLHLRDDILPGDNPLTWQGPLFGAIDSMRGYLNSEGQSEASGVAPLPDFGNLPPFDRQQFHWCPNCGHRLTDDEGGEVSGRE